MAPQLKLIELLSSINKEMENLEQAESDEDFATAWAGLLTVLLPEKEPFIQPPPPMPPLQCRRTSSSPSFSLEVLPGEYLQSQAWR